MKAQFYSLITVLIVAPLMMYILFYITASQTIGYSGAEKVVADQIQQVERNIERDFGRAVGISCRRALLAASSNIITEGRYVNSSADILLELMLNGTLGGNESFYMINNTLENWKSAMLDIETGFETILDYDNLQIENHDGLNVKAAVNLSVSVSDKLGIAGVDRGVKKTVLVSVKDINDPIFPLNTQGYIKRSIREYPYPYYAVKIVKGNSSGSCSGVVSFDPEATDSEKILVTRNASGISGFRGVVGETDDAPDVSCYIIGASGAVELINQTIMHSNYTQIYLDSNTSGVWSLPINEGIANGYYYKENGPDMLMRLEGNLSPSVNGFQTFVSIPELETQGVPVRETQTRVAYLYFSDQIYNGQRVRGLPDWFRIDAEHAAIYNLTELLD